MADLRINTEAVVSVANNLKMYNTQMKDALPRVESAMNNLNKSWDGEASNAAIAKFNEIKSKFADTRYDVLENYVKFLLQQVGEGYTQTEDVNKSLAAQFK